MPPLLKTPLLVPFLTLALATLFTWRPWVGHGVDDVMLWAATTSFTHDGDVDVTDDLMHASNPVDVTREMLLAVWPTGAKSNPYPVGYSVLWAPVEMAASPLLTAGLSEPIPRFHPRVRAVVSLVALLLAWVSLHLFTALAMRAGMPPWPAALAASVLFAGSSLVLFSTRWPAMTHQLSALTVAAHVWALLRWRQTRLVRWAFTAGVAAGFMTLVRWQNVLYLVAALSLLIEWSVRDRPGVRKALGHAVVTLVPLALLGALQPLVWWLGSGHWLLIPQGAEYLENESAHLAILFSGFHGLFPSHPAFALVVIGLLLLLRRDPWLGGALLVAFALLVHVNQMVWDWWGAEAFGQRRFSSFVGPGAIALAEVLRLLRWRWVRGAVVGLLMLWALFFIRLYEIEGEHLGHSESRGDDLTLLFTGQPATTPRIGTPLTDPAALREEALEIFTDPLDGLLRPQLFESLDKHRFPAAPLFGVAVLAGLGLFAWGFVWITRHASPWTVPALSALALLWGGWFAVRLLLDDQDWRTHAAEYHAFVFDPAIREASPLPSAIPDFDHPEATQAVAARFLTLERRHAAGQWGASESVQGLLSEETAHLYPPITGVPLSGIEGLYRAHDPASWLVWRRTVEDGGIQ